MSPRLPIAAGPVFATHEHETMIALADEIRREHALAISSASEAVEHAIKCGQLLNEAKASVGHGSWAEWLAANFPKSERTARNYMRLAEQKDALQNRQRVADLTVRGALAALSTPRAKSEQPVTVAPDDVEPVAAPAVLSERDQAISDLHAERFGAPEIAAKLGVSPSTVNEAKRRLFPKNPLRSLTDNVSNSTFTICLAIDQMKCDGATKAQRDELVRELRHLAKVANEAARRFEVNP